jgi:hypothetical protein
MLFDTVFKLLDFLLGPVFIPEPCVFGLPLSTPLVKIKVNATRAYFARSSGGRELLGNVEVLQAVSTCGLFQKVDTIPHRRFRPQVLMEGPD